MHTHTHTKESPLTMLRAIVRETSVGPKRLTRAPTTTITTKAPRARLALEVQHRTTKDVGKHKGYKSGQCQAQNRLSTALLRCSRNACEYIIARPRPDEKPNSWYSRLPKQNQPSKKGVSTALRKTYAITLTVLTITETRST